MKSERSAARMRSRKVSRISLVCELGSFLITRAEETRMPRGAAWITASRDRKSALPPSLQRSRKTLSRSQTIDP